MSVNIYDKTNNQLKPIAGKLADDGIYAGNVLSTVEECQASTNPRDVVGASVLANGNNGSKWALAGSTTSNTVFNIPTNILEIADEFCIIVKNKTNSRTYSLNMPKIQMIDSSSCALGYGNTSANFAIVFITTDTVQLSNYYEAGKQDLANTVTSVYYR